VSELPPLAVRGARLVRRDTGATVRLRGLNRSGLEYVEPDSRGFLGSAHVSLEEIACIADWGANIIRVPFNQDFVLRGRGAWSGEDYLGALDTVIDWAAAHGVYTLLDLQWLDAETPHGADHGGTINRVPPLPDARTPDLWTLLARRYRDRPSVLFDLFNEPHDPLLDDVTPLVGSHPDGRLERLPSRQVSMAEWQPWARRLVEIIRSEHPSAIVFVSGVRWAFDLRGLPLRTRGGHLVEGLVYSTHVYPWSRTGLVRLRPHAREWERAFGHLAGHVPVFAGEWGGDARHLAWGGQLLAYLDERAIGWAAWSWADWPCLVCDHRSGDFTPTPFGAVVREGLRGGNPRAAGVV
jgi:endoglucanase